MVMTNDHALARLNASRSKHCLQSRTLPYSSSRREEKIDRRLISEKPQGGRRSVFPPHLSVGGFYSIRLATV